MLKGKRWGNICKDGPIRRPRKSPFLFTFRGSGGRDAACDDNPAFSCSGCDGKPVFHNRSEVLVLHKRRLPVLSGWRRKIATPLAAWFPLILLSACSLLPDLCEGASTIPGEGQHGFFYAVTHLHPVVYLILFLIAVLSVINLVVQGWVPLKSMAVLHGLTASPQRWGGRASTVLPGRAWTKRDLIRRARLNQARPAITRRAKGRR